MPQRIYLDNAATSWPKPEPVYQAVDQYQRQVGAAAGRGVYGSAGDAQRIVSRCRRLVAGQLGVADPTRVVFTGGCTEALNLAIFGLVRPGDHVVTTDAEHNAVLRPLAALRRDADVEVEYAPVDTFGRVDPAAIATLIRPNTRLVAVTAASNVTGAVNDVPAIGAACREAGAALLVDAAQSLGHAPVDVAAAGVGLLAAPGHKGLLGPLGVGMLYIAPELGNSLKPLHLGGTGSMSESEQVPDELPGRYEAGNLNVPAIAGLAAAMEAAAEADFANGAHAAAERLRSRLAELPAVTLHTPPSDAAPVVSLSVEGYDPHDVAGVLASAGIECRSGLHCAARIHGSLGPAAGGGTLRLSPGYSTTADEVDAAVETLAQLAAFC